MSVKCNVAYVIQAVGGGVVKVGLSGNPRSRIASIRQTVPFEMEIVALLADGKQTERQMKDLLEPWKRRGEWYDPRKELNDFLADKRRYNKVLAQREIDEEFSENFIKPYVLEYLAGREPKFNEGGDLVARYLRCGIESVRGRLQDLNTAVQGAIPAELMGGYVPLAQDAETPAVIIGQKVVA